MRAETSLFALVFVAIGVAAKINMGTSQLSLIGQIPQRTIATVLDVMVASLLGVAVGLALLTKMPEILVGVACLACAHRPPAVRLGRHCNPLT